MWAFGTGNRPAADPYDLIERIARHQNRDIENVLGEARLTHAELAGDPLSD